MSKNKDYIINFVNGMCQGSVSYYFLNLHGRADWLWYAYCVVLFVYIWGAVFELLELIDWAFARLLNP